MKKCLLLLMAIILLTKTYAQDDTTAFAINSLSFFHVQSVEKLVMLKWSVEESEEYKSFDIERADDGVHFFKVGSKLAISKNNSDEYEFVDATPVKNILLRYRLKLITKDGSVSYSAFKETKVTDAQWAIRLKQNPVRSNIEIEVEALAAKQASVAVVSNSGQQMTSQTFRLSAGKNQLSLSAQSLGQGIYQLMVEVDNKRKTISFIKE